MDTSRVRYLPGAALPAYAYVPGRFPHPVSDPAGHAHGESPPPAVPVIPERWAESHDYLLGIDLFNHGYYWEAHEAWERLWHAAGRKGPTANVLQGLIKLAASGVKVREGRAAGTRRLAEGANDLFRTAREALSDHPSHLGLRFIDLFAFAQQAETCATDQPDDDPGIRIVFAFVLAPHTETAP
jgi:predicted metal-dependent hydrolase